MGPKVSDSNEARSLPRESSRNRLPNGGATEIPPVTAGLRGEGTPLAVGYAALFVTIGVYMPFFPLFLAARGLGPEAIGVAIAIPVVVRLAAMPLAGVVADRIGWPRALLAALGVAAGLGFLLVGAASGPALTFAALAFAALFWAPTVPLLESYAVRLTNLGRIDYGRVRLWGSAAFIAANLAAGWALGWLDPGAVVWLIAAALAAFALLCARLAPLPQAPPAEEAGPFRPPAALVLGVLACAVVQASHALLYAFASLHWTAAGLDLLTIGALWSAGVLAEIVLFTFGTRALGRSSALALIAIGGGAALFRFAAMAFDPPAAFLFALQLLHGLTFGATHLGLMALIGASVPARASGRAQTFASTAIGLATALATVAAGALYADFGARAFLASALLGAGGAVLALVAAARAKTAAH